MQRRKSLKNWNLLTINAIKPWLQIKLNSAINFRETLVLLLVKTA